MFDDDQFRDFNKSFKRTKRAAIVFAGVWLMLVIAAICVFGYVVHHFLMKVW
jgi:hypothetical protein